MSRLVWSPENTFEFGVDRCVFYPEGSNASVWNGIVKVSETFSDAATAYYFDGVKYFDEISTPVSQFTITTLDVPENFGLVSGIHTVVPGFFVTNQPKSTFGFSYRTLVGNKNAYKIHIIHNAKLDTSSVVYKTIGSKSEFPVYSYTIDALPLDYQGKTPTSHFIIDSEKVSEDTLLAVEDILYGTQDDLARLPTYLEYKTLLDIQNQNTNLEGVL